MIAIIFSHPKHESLNGKITLSKNIVQKPDKIILL
jgi:hypothetical protein